MTKAAGEARCNCLVTWDAFNERHAWVNGSLDGSCGHPPDGSPFYEVGVRQEEGA